MGVPQVCAMLALLLEAMPLLSADKVPVLRALAEVAADVKMVKVQTLSAPPATGAPPPPAPR